MYSPKREEGNSPWVKKMLASEALLRALKNERVLRKMPFLKMGCIPGPEPVVRIPASKLLVDKEAQVFYIGLDDLIELVRGVLAAGVVR